MTFRRILCAVDLLQDSPRTFQIAAEIARQFRQSLKVLHVIEALPNVPELPPVRNLSGMVVNVEEKAMAAMQVLIKSSAEDLDGITLSMEIDTGEPFVEILNHARRWKADLIVLGSKGTTTLEEVFVGRTAEHVTREAPCSVLIVR